MQISRLLKVQSTFNYPEILLKRYTKGRYNESFILDVEHGNQLKKGDVKGKVFTIFIIFKDFNVEIV